MLKKKLLGSLVLIALVSGCDTDDSADELPSESLPGVWKSTCQERVTESGYEYSSMITYEFTEPEIILKNTYYYDLVCEDFNFESTYSGTYEIGELVSTPNGVDATEIDIVLTERTTSLDLEIEDVDYTLLDLFVIEGTYLYLGDDSGEDGARPEDIDYSYSLELQE
jgi:hypothetical protein